MSEITINNLTKQYGNVYALKGLSCNFEANQINALLGRNGAGKTTLLSILTNKIFPTTGVILFNNQNITENQKELSRICSTMETDNSYFMLTKIKDMIKHYKIFYDDFDEEYFLELAYKFKLDTKKNFEKLSTGNKTILKNILTIASNAETMIFDEPILGLDANHRELFYKTLIEKYANINNTIIISTHLIDEIASFVNTLVIIKNGNLVYNGSTFDFVQNSEYETLQDAFINLTNE